MELKKTNCTECGSPIAISDDVDYINCAACGSFFAVERGEGYISLKAVEKITKAIQDTGVGTQDVIRESTQVTRAELQRLQVSQEIAMAEMKLGNIQAEIRGLERAERTPKTQQQISNLRGIEYNAMDELRRMHLTAAALGPQDIDSRLKTAEFHFNWINTQRNVLSQSDFPSTQKKQAVFELDVLRGQVRKEVFDLRTEQIKGNLRTFRTSTLPLDNLAEAQIFMQLLNDDEAKIRRMPPSPETLAVLKELSDRKIKVTDAWTQLENKRVSSVLRSPSLAINQNELASLRNHLTLVNEDLNTINQMPQNNVVKGYASRLTEQQQTLVKQITKLEKDARRAEEQARKNALKTNKNVQEKSSTTGAVKTGILAGFLVGLTVMFGGIAALAKEIFASIFASKQPPGEPPLAPLGTAFMQSGEFTQPTQTGSPSTLSDFTIGAYPYRQPSRLEFRALAKGCSLGLLITVGFFIVGFVIFGLAFSNTANQGNDIGIGILFLVTALGFALGSLIFLRNVAPLTRIKGVGAIKDIVINRHPKKPGLNNPLAVKGLTGVITCVLLYLIFMSISMMLPQDSALWAFCPGVLLGPILGALISRQTYLAEPEML